MGRPKKKEPQVRINKTVLQIQAKHKLDNKELTKKGKPKRRQKPKCVYETNTGHKLTIMEAKFIDLYIEYGNQRQAVIEAGYKTKVPGQYGQTLLDKNYIREEINFRLKKLEESKIATAEEIMQYFTSVMRGEEKDQFGLDAPLGERTKAAQELAKRKIDIVNRVNDNKGTAEVQIKLDWGGMDNE